MRVGTIVLGEEGWGCRGEPGLGSLQPGDEFSGKWLQPFHSLDASPMVKATRNKLFPINCYFLTKKKILNTKGSIMIKKKRVVRLVNLFQEDAGFGVVWSVFLF